jgi:hypothetical protein
VLGADTRISVTVDGTVYAGQVESVYGRQVEQGSTVGGAGVYDGGGETQEVVLAVINAPGEVGYPPVEIAQT